MGMLDDKAVLITGAGSGIGAATALICAREGAKIAIADVYETGGEKVASEISANGGNAFFVHCDVTSESEIESMVAQTVSRFGGLHGAFNNAGIAGSFDQLTEMTVEDWSRVIAINLTGVWLCMKHEIPAMIAGGGGAIVNTSSIAGLIGTTLSIAYSASKHGVTGITKSAAKGYGLDGIRVNAVCPGVIDTPLAVNSPLFDDSNIKERSMARHLLGRYGEPSEIGEVVAWLLSDAASFITGAAVPVDAGYTS